MNIFGHILPDSAILGIGPLMVEYNNTSMYGERKRYYFDLHLSAHTTVVKSDWFPSNQNDEQWKAWKEEHRKLADKISVQVGEPTDSRIRFEEDVQKVIDNSLAVLENISLELEPGLPSTNLRVLRLIDNINELKTLALK